MSAVFRVPRLYLGSRLGADVRNDSFRGRRFISYFASERLRNIAINLSVYSVVENQSGCRGSMTRVRPTGETKLQTCTTLTSFIPNTVL